MKGEICSHELEQLIKRFSDQIRAGSLNKEELHRAMEVAEKELDLKKLISLRTIEIVSDRCTGLLPVFRVAENCQLLVRLRNPTAFSQLGAKERIAFEQLFQADLVYNAWGQIGLTTEGLEWSKILR